MRTTTAPLRTAEAISCSRAGDVAARAAALGLAALGLVGVVALVQGPSKVWYPGKGLHDTFSHGHEDGSYYPGKGMYGIFHTEEFKPPPGMPEGTECHEVAPWLENAINDATMAVVAEIPNRPKLSRLPLSAKVRVGLVTTDVKNMSIDALSIGRVRMAACRRPRPILKFLPRLLPDVVLVNFDDFNVTQGMLLETSGLWGFGAISATALSHLRGTLNLTISYERQNATRVTACAGDFVIGSTELVGPTGNPLDLPPLPMPMPIGRILCYGPQALLGPVSGLVDVELEGNEGTRFEGMSKHFEGLVPMLNRRFAAMFPGAEYIQEIEEHGLFGQRELPPAE